MKNIFLINFALILISAKSFSQDFEKSIYFDEIFSYQFLNQNLFFKNPAAILKSNKSNWIKAIPNIKQIENKNFRKFDAKSISIYETNFITNKRFDSASNFWGYAKYRLEHRSNVYGSVKYSPYSGEAFFLTDTTAGNFLYKGPKVGFNYSRIFFKKIHFAITGNYQIFDGLKNKYSQAQSFSRAISGGSGIIYSIDSINNFGIDFKFGDKKEAINISSPEVKIVEIHNYRGEKYFINERSSSINKNVFYNDYSIGFQSYLKIYKNLNSGFFAKFLNGKNSTIDEAELMQIIEGVSFYKQFNFKLLLDYFIKNNILLFVNFNYLLDDNYSSLKNKLIWEWNNSFLSGEIGTKINFNKNLKINFDLEFVHSKFDSSKHIEMKFNSGKGNNFRFKSLIDYKVNEVISINLAGIKSLKEETTYSENIFSDAIISEMNLKLNSNIIINFGINYLRYNSKFYKFNEFNFLIGIKLIDF